MSELQRSADAKVTATTLLTP